KRGHRLQRTVAIAQQNSDVSSTAFATTAKGRAIHHNHVELAIPIHVCDGNVRGSELARWISHDRLKRAVSISQQHSDISLVDADACAAVCYDDVCLIVA